MASKHKMREMAHSIHMPHLHPSSVHLRRPSHWVWIEKLSSNKQMRNTIIAAIVVVLLITFLLWLAYISPEGANTFEDPLYYYGY